MKKIFILTGEPSGDKLASKVISKIQKNDPDIKYSCVGGTHLNSLGIKSIFDLNEITYIGFTSVLLNIFRIKSKINIATKKINTNESEKIIADFNKIKEEFDKSKSTSVKISNSKSKKISKK